MNDTGQGFGGWRLVSASALFVVALCIAVLWTFGVEEAGTRAAVRATARASMVFFTAAYVASALRLLWPSPVSDWLVRNRPYLGFSLGISHTAHAVFLVRLFSHWQPFDPAGSAPALAGYVLLALMLATSNDAGRKMLGERGWHRLHMVGMHYLWFVFTYTMAMSLAGAPSFQKAVLTLISFTALGIRIAGTMKARRAVSEPAVAGS